MKSYKIILSCLLAFCMASLGLQAQNTLPGARVYINPGHEGWGSNDRPLATINYAALDSMSFFESKANLWKGLHLREILEKAGATVRMSKTVNGVYAPTETWPNSNPNSKYPEIPEGTVVDGVRQIITLSVICQDVETNNMDYFLSIHSNASTDGTSANFPLLLYRGTDAANGNGLTQAKQMATDAWKYIQKNGVTYYSAYSATNANVRGDVNFYGSGSEGALGYYGYLGVLKHGCNGYLSEGSFHTYHPDRHRLLNRDYCRQEAVRMSRAIRAWFGDNTETKGDIMGTVKDKSKALIHTWYQSPQGYDIYYPLNGAKVTLKDAGGQKVADYTTDKEYNGIFVFTGLTPGKYTLVFNADGFDEKTTEITVVANETAFINQLMGDEFIPDPACIDYKDPEQDAYVRAADSYEFEQEGEVTAIDELNGLTVRRALLRDGKCYVLAVDASKNPKLLAINPETGALIKEMSTAGISTTGYNGKSHAYNLSDIAFTADGVLIGTNSTVVGNVGNAYQTGDFYVYKWEAKGATALEDATPQVVIKLPTNDGTSLAPVGNNNSNFVGNTIAVSGCSNDFKLFFNSLPGNKWDTSIGNFSILYIGWRVKDGVRVASQRNATKYATGNTDCESLRINLSPLGDDRFVLDGSLIKPTEILFNWVVADEPTYSDFSGNVPTGSSGATYFRYAGKTYMSAPIVESQQTHSYNSRLFDITGGMNNAKLIGETDAVITGEATKKYTTCVSVVDNANICLYLLAGNKLVKYRTFLQAPANYPDPIQDPDTEAKDFYKFYPEGDVSDAPWLNEGNIKRAIHRNGKLYVLTKDASPKIFIADPATLDVIKEMDLTGVSGGQAAISDIAFTSDDKLLACNKQLIATPETQGRTFKTYIWDNDESVPAIYFEMAGNTSANFIQGLIGETMAVSGPSWKSTFYLPVISRNIEGTGSWNVIRFVTIEKETDVAPIASYYGKAPTDKSTLYMVEKLGSDFQIMISPRADDYFIVTSSEIPPTELQLNKDYANAPFPGGTDGNNSTDIAITRIGVFEEASGYNLFKTNGANYFRYAGRSYMAAPTADAGRVKAGVVLFDITDGLDQAVKLSEKLPEAGLGTAAAPYMTAYGVVDNKDIILSILAENQGFAQFTTVKGTGINVPQPQSEVRVYPNPVENVVRIECGFEIKTIKLFDLTGRTVMNISVNEKQKTIDMSGVNSGNYILLVNNIPVKVIKK